MSVFAILMLALAIGVIFGVSCSYDLENSLAARQQQEKDNGRHRQDDPQVSVNPPGNGSSSGAGTQIYTLTSGPFRALSTITSSPSPYSSAQQLTALQSIARQQANLQYQSYLNGLRSMTPVVMGQMSRNAFEETVAQEPVQDDGIVIGETIAWRCWTVTHGYLCSVYVGSIWAPGEPMTGVIKSDHGQADSGGVHAWKTMQQSLQYGLPGAMAGHVFAVGRVALYGLIIEHERGFRAENARVISIEDVIGPENRAAILDDVRAKYCPSPPHPALRG